MNSTGSVLLIEDEEKTAMSLRMGLEEKNFSVKWYADANSAMGEALSNKYDIIVSDIIMPGISGTELCQTLRDNGNNTPVLLITALGTLEDKIKGFNSGSDDYLVKPFAFDEMVARIKSLIKRSKGQVKTERTLYYGSYSLSLDERIFRKDDSFVELTPREFSLLEYFLKNSEKVVTRVEIAEKIWHINFDSGTNIIDVYVNYLRRKLERTFRDKLIHTRHGLGYVLRES